ncbi:hypothetical protein FISHEDRAFT_33601 [Fistulina hepatica ATCC 64428]|uniref:Lipid droplet-associated perilipin protein n=1 Tax=Fistulina hepatica ATCC 64428 TaxID=1128425 RepID=A0A0D7APS2_9AGAR|nr:hypothetical protein FISHEDRAFT_33601 [Fistulina hepatica ATCC 64428]
MPTSKEGPPELKIFTRVCSIPMISTSLEKINEALVMNAYTSSPYSMAKDLSTSAYKYTEPLQERLAPILLRADGLANKAVDVVEARYPYPFHAKPEEVVDLVRTRSKSATDFVRTRQESATAAATVLDEKVRAPAVHAAQDIDQRFTPIIDYLEAHLKSDSMPASPETKYQYQRALALVIGLRDHFSVYSNEQLKQLQTQSVLIQRATETAQSLSAAASSSVTAVQARIHALSEIMVQQLQHLQESTAALAASLQAQIPPQVEQTYAELATGLSTTVTDLRNIMLEKDVPLQEKATKVRQEVGERVTPLLENVRKGLTDVLTHRQASPDAAPPDGRAQPVNGKPSKSRKSAKTKAK